MKTVDIQKAMAKRYSLDKGWCLGFEVGNLPGNDYSGWCDAVAVGFWRTHNHKIHGFEFKVSRSDWLKEIENPQKSQKFVDKCNHFWVVAPKGIIHDSELPDDWGFMRISARGTLQIVKDAPKRVVEPDRLVPFMIAIMSRLSKSATEIAKFSHNDTVAKVGTDLRNARKAGYEDGKKQIEAQIKELEKAKEILSVMDKIYGYGWRYNWQGPGKFVEDVKFAVNLKRDFKFLKSSVDRIHQVLNDCQEVIEKEANDGPE